MSWISSRIEPMNIVLHQQSGVLELSWQDGLVVHFRPEVLRRACRCSVCEYQRRTGQGIEPGSENDGDKILIESITPIGVIGLQFSFSDGHDRGIYPWAYLRELSQTNSAKDPSIGAFYCE